MTLQIAISPCPNDTFIFEHLYLHPQLGEHTLNFEFEDIETLNFKAQHQEADIVKISYAQYFDIADHYQLLESGSALGFGVGPLLVTRTPEANIPLQDLKVAIPGIHTTAHFLLRFAFPEIMHKMAMPFHQIEEAVLNGSCDAGLLIHENRFTYAQKGLHLIKDLGQYWEEKTHLPIPLGGIAIKRSLPVELKIQVESAIQNSIEKAHLRSEPITPFIASHAQEMDHEVMKQHIQLYVNEYSLQIGEIGKAGIFAMQKILAPHFKQSIFIH